MFLSLPKLWFFSLHPVILNHFCWACDFDDSLAINLLFGSLFYPLFIQMFLISLYNSKPFVIILEFWYFLLKLQLILLPSFCNPFNIFLCSWTLCTHFIIPRHLSSIYHSNPFVIILHFWSFPLHTLISISLFSSYNSDHFSFILLFRSFWHYPVISILFLCYCDANHIVVILWFWFLNFHPVILIIVIPVLLASSKNSDLFLQMWIRSISLHPLTLILFLIPNLLPSSWHFGPFYFIFDTNTFAIIL